MLAVMELSAAMAENIPQSAGGAGEEINLISLVKGFSRIFWGLVLTAVLLLSQTRIEFLTSVRLPAFFAGTALHFWGVATLWRAGLIGPRWRGRLLLAGLLVLLEIYFFPFALWWKAMPYVLYFACNVGVLILSVIASLFVCNMIAADVFRSFSLKGECLEAQIYGVAVVFFMALPLLVAVVSSMIAALRYETVFCDELIGLIYRVPVWLYIIVMIPFSLTLATLWKARDRSYQRFCLTKKTK